MSQLSGMKEICNFYNRSEPTMLALIRNQDFPAWKSNGGIWESDTELIAEWRKKKILETTEKTAPTKKKKPSAKKRPTAKSVKEGK